MKIPRRPNRFIEAIGERFHMIGLAVEEDVIRLRSREAIHTVIRRRRIEKRGCMSMGALLGLDEEEFANGRPVIVVIQPCVSKGATNFCSASLRSIANR